MSTHSMITIPHPVTMRWMVDGDGDEISLAFGTDDRVVLEIEYGAIERLVSALTQARETAAERRAEASAQLAE